VTGIDLTDAYCETAEMLSSRVGLSDLNSFCAADATRLPFEDASFDVVWTEHVQMNIEDKERFYGEMSRVLAPGGRIAFHDIFAGEGGRPRFPVPWAEVSRLSHLRPAGEVRGLLEDMGLEVEVWEDETGLAAEWFRAALERMQSGGRPPLGLHILMGATAPTKFQNILHALENERIVTIQAVLRRAER
jgi:SAM-dependent methyltransferase